MNKCGHPYNGVIFGNMKGQPVDTLDNMGELFRVPGDKKPYSKV